MVGGRKIHHRALENEIRKKKCTRKKVMIIAACEERGTVINWMPVNGAQGGIEKNAKKLPEKTRWCIWNDPPYVHEHRHDVVTSRKQKSFFLASQSFKLIRRWSASIIPPLPRHVASQAPPSIINQFVGQLNIPIIAACHEPAYKPKIFSFLVKDFVTKTVWWLSIRARIS